jgi:solute carrier family 30 (zinc transporter), member 1
LATGSTVGCILQWSVFASIGREHLSSITGKVHHFRRYVCQLLGCSNKVDINNPMLVVIIGAIGLALNIVSIIFLHGTCRTLQALLTLEHDHDHENPHPGELPLQVPRSHHGIAMATLDIGSTQSIDHLGQSTHREHRHTHKERKDSGHHHDFGMMGVLLHVAGDAVNNIGVIIAGLIIWKVKSPERFYADPAVGMGISLMILLTSIPLVKKTGHILLQSPPLGIDVDDIKHDLEQIPTVQSVHELHVWRLNQKKSLASAHVVVPSSTSVEQFQDVARTINECLHAYGVHSVTLQPEVELRRRPIASRATSEEGIQTAIIRPTAAAPVVLEPQETDEPVQSDDACQMNCGTGCEKMTCCG